MMAIGDSMYQGVRSLSFTASLGRYSPPAQVAGSLGVPFLTPNPRLPFLFDLEQMIRQGVVHLALAANEIAAAIMQVWLNGDPWSQHAAFDNIAVGGAEISSLWDDTYAEYWPKIPGLLARIKASSVPDFTTIWALWYALNVCFTLNPQHLPAQADKTQLDQVMERQPKLLLVNIGSNEGLFDAGFLGDLSDAVFASVRNIPEKIGPVAQRLAGLPDDTIIAFNSLVRPRCASNLMPSADDNSSPGDGYFSAYGPRLLSTQQDIAGSRLQAFDELTADVNAQVEALLKQTLGTKLRWVDLYASSTDFDGKHYQDRAVVAHPNGVTHPLRNVPLFCPFGHLFMGGLTGIDNMHPSVVGYALIADAVLAALGRPERIDKDAAFLNDTLLTDLPANLPIVQAGLAAIGSLATFKMTGAAPSA